MVGWTLVVDRSWASDLLEIVGSVRDSCSGYRDPAPFDHASTVQCDNFPLEGSEAVEGARVAHKKLQN